MDNTLITTEYTEHTASLGFLMRDGLIDELFTAILRYLMKNMMAFPLAIWLIFICVGIGRLV